MGNKLEEDDYLEMIDFDSSDLSLPPIPKDYNVGMQVDDDGYVDADLQDIEVPVPAIMKEVAKPKKVVAPKQTTNMEINFEAMIGEASESKQEQPMQLPSKVNDAPPAQSAAPLDDIHEEIKLKIESVRASVDYDLGIKVFEKYDSPEMDKSNLLHQAIFYAKWNPFKLQGLDAKYLCGMECVFASNQVYIQSLENKFLAESVFLAKEKDRMFREVRHTVSGPTEKDKDNKIIRMNSQMRQIFVNHKVAEYMSHYLSSMGLSFSQMHNGIKRTIDQKLFELKTSAYQNK